MWCLFFSFSSINPLDNREKVIADLQLEGYYLDSVATKGSV